MTGARVLRHPAATVGRTVADLAAAHLEWMTRRVESGRMAPATVVAARSRYRCHILPHLASERLEDFGVAEAERWHAMVSARGGLVVANRSAAILRSAWFLAELWRWTPAGSNPWRAFRLFKNPEQPRLERLKPAQAVELDAVLERMYRGAGRIEERRAALALALILETGCRPKEIAKLTRAQVHASAGSIDLPKTKTKKPRYVILSERGRELAALALELGGDSALFERANLPAAWAEAKKAIGAPTATMHDLRRTFASALGDSGADLSDAAKMTGHESVAVHRDHYRVLGFERRRDLANQASAAIRGK